MILSLLQETPQVPASGPSSPPAANPLVSLFPLLLIFVIFYFIMLRPERKRQKRRQEMLKALKKNDRVVTSGGIHGTVLALDDRIVVLRVDDQVRMRFSREAITAVVEREDGAEEGRGGPA